LEDIVVSLDINIGLFKRAASEVIQPDAVYQRSPQDKAQADVGGQTISDRNDQQHRAENEKNRPDKGDDAPRGLVVNDTVGREAPDAVNREKAEADVLNERRAEGEKETENEGEPATTN